MQRIFEVLEQRGLVSETDFPVISKLNHRDFVRLYEDIYTTLLSSQKESRPEHDEHGLDPFTFFVGPSLRGDLGCWEPLCRLQKLDFLGHYTALYANEVTLPFNLEHPDKVDDGEHARKLLTLSALTLLRLRPLVTAKLLKPVVMYTFHCVHTIKAAREMTKLLHALAELEAKDWADDFSVSYQLAANAPSGMPTVYMEGPQEFLDHGGVVLTPVLPRKPFPKTWKFDRAGKHKLTSSWKVPFVAKVFHQIATDTDFFLAYGLYHRARFLTDRRGDILFFPELDDNENISATTVAMECLNHAVPILADLPIATLLRIRRQERDAFQSYRKAVGRIAADVLSRNRRLSKREARDMFRSIIEPELARLRKEVRAERTRQRNRFIGGLGTLAAGIAIGAFSGLPTGVGAAAGVAGGHVIGKAMEAACEHGATLRQQNDLYFLLRLMDEAG